MTKRERAPKLLLLCCCVLAWGTMFLFVSIASAIAESSASVSEASTVSSGNWGRGEVELPGGMDPAEVVRVVERNRAVAAQEASMREADETSRPRCAGMDGQVGSAFQIGGPSAAPQVQYSAAVAFDGTNYLVVWEDWRSGFYGDIYGARVSVGGSVIDSLGIAISTAPEDQYTPAIAFDGTNYLVVWWDYRNGVYPDIYGARVSVGGSVLDQGGIAISTAVAGQYAPEVAFDGTNYLVAWGDYRSGIDADIYGARVSVGGSVLDPAGIAISTATGSQLYPAVAFDGTNYLLVWCDSRSGSNYDIYGARVSAGGSVLDPGGKAICVLANDQTSPDIAFDGTNYLVAWEDYRSGASWDIYGARVSVGGVVWSLPSPICAVEGDQTDPDIAFGGTNYFVAWEDYRSKCWHDIYGARVDAAGAVLDGMGVIVSTGANGKYSPAVAFDGTNYFVVWEDYRSGIDEDIYGARVNDGGGVLDPKGILLSTGAVGAEGCPAVAFDGTSYFVVWEDCRNYGSTSWDIYGARVDVAGNVLDAAGIAISAAADAQRYPAVAFDGTNYLVVWSDHRSGTSDDIYGARVSVGGSVLDVSGITISSAASHQTYPAIAFDGTNYLVVWMDYRSASTYDIYGTRVTVGGSVLDAAGIAMCTEEGHQNYPAIAFGAINYLVAWEDYRNGIISDIYGTRVSVGGVVLDPSGISISTAVSHQMDPDVAFGGANYFVAWDDYRSGSIYDIYGARVSVGGMVLDASGIAISTGDNDKFLPAVAFDGTNYFVAWEDGRSADAWDIYGARVSVGGSVLDPYGIAITTAAGNQYYACVGMGPYGQLLIGYESPVAGGYNCQLIWGNLWGQYVGVEQEETPRAFRMCQSYPNPFNPFCTIRYEIAYAGRVSLRIFDVRGSLVRTLVDGWRDAGVYSEMWNGRRDDGSELPSGVYFYRLEAGGFLATHKMVLLK